MIQNEATTAADDDTMERNGGAIGENSYKSAKRRKELTGKNRKKKGSVGLIVRNIPRRNA
jgi:hypothetical protein